MEQEWKIKEVREGQTWENSYGTFKSYSLVLEGHAEPVSMNKKFPVASPPQAGEALYGIIELVKNKNGTVTNKFVSKQRPEASQGPVASPAASGSSWHESPEKQASINRAVALNNAVMYVGAMIGVTGEGVFTEEGILGTADKFYAWLCNDKQSDKANVTQVMGEVQEEPVNLDDIPF